jgi:septal ring-binding cell division protein DamX
MSDFYQSPGDKLRFDILLKTLREGSLNLAILGDDDIALAHYARMIFQGLREPGKIEVELWTSADSEKLVQRFNDILSEVSVDQALDKSQRAATKRYMVFPDTQSIQDIDLQLLARLINGFPASNIHVVLLVNRLEPHERKLSAFGKNLMQWVLESEHPAPAKPQRMQRIETRDESPAASSEPLVHADSDALVKPSAPAAFDPVLSAAAAPAPSWEEPAQEQPVKPGNSRLAWGLLGVFVLSLGLSAYLYRAPLLAELENMQSYLSRSDKSGKTAKDAGVPPVPAVNMSSTTQLPVKPDDSLIPEKEAIIKTEDKAESAPVAPPAATPVAVAPAPVASPPSRAQEEKAWVNNLPAAGWVLQHAAFDTQQEIESFQAKTPVFKDGQVLKTQRKTGATYFILVTGPYATRQEAENLIKTNPAMAKSWLRATKSLKTQFQD